ncbi:MAG: hypothetical protein AB1491_01290 [Thermodesulfobacteriota bacterium]
MDKHYVFLDAMQIQRYIFATNTLKTIIGASLALSRWQEKCRELCDGYGGRLIYSAGGNVLTCFSDSPKAQQFRIRAVTEIAPPGLEIAWAEAEGTDPESVTWEKLQLEIARYKAGDRDKDYTPYSTPGIPGCGHCGLRAPDSGPLIDKKKFCSNCRTLYFSGGELDKYPVGTTLMEFLYQQVDKERFPGIFPRELDLLVSHKNPLKSSHNMAVVVIDLNDVGRRINAIVQQNGFSGLQQFSQDLESGIKAMLLRVLKYLENHPDGAGLADNQKYLRLRPLLVGGDDIVLALPAPLWPGLVAEALNELQDRGCPACAGVVAARHTFPVNRLVSMAEELVANAKKLTRYRQGQNACFNECVLDWHFHQETAFTSPLQLRRRNFVKLIEANKSNETYEVATRRPYPLAEFLRLRDQVDKITASNRKLYTLYKGLRAGVKATRDTLVYTFLRDEKDGMDKYPYLWDLVTTTPGEYPLWSSREFSRNNLHIKLYETEVTDILELKFLLDTDDTEVEDV